MRWLQNLTVPPPRRPIMFNTTATTHPGNRLSCIVSDHFKLLQSITSLLQILNPSHPNSSTPQPNTALFNRFIPHLTPSLLIEIIKIQKSPYHSLFFFNFASSHVAPTHRCYIAITDHLLSLKQISSAKSLLEKHNKLSDFFVGKLIKAHGDLGQINSSLKLFNKIKRRENGFCLFSYNALLGVLVKHDRVELAWGILGKMIKESVVKPDVSSYTIMIRGFCKVGLVEIAKKLFGEMECEKNIVCYNTMINGLAKKGLLEYAQKLVDEMFERGTDGCLPDVITYGTLIDGYCKKGEIKEAMRCFDQMIERGCKANALVYNALINGLCSNGEVDQAKQMMTAMRLSGLRDDVTTHTCLLKGYCIARRSEEAISHFKEMASLDEKAYAVIVNEYCKLRRPDEATALILQMASRNMNPSVSGLNAVLRSYVELGEVDRAIRVLKQMRQLGIEPNFISYSTIIESLVEGNNGRMREVQSLVTRMYQNGHRLDTTLYSCLVKGYSEEGNDKMALQSLKEMIDERYVINVESFEVFVKELCAKGKVLEVEQLFERMKHCFPFVSLEIYQGILNKALRGT